MAVTIDPHRDEWDVVVLGGAAAGENAAAYASQFSGLSSVIVESAPLGGECSYWACMPSKALLTPVENVEIANHVPGCRHGSTQPKPMPGVTRSSMGWMTAPRRSGLSA
ncbi:FAD-dependent oxidoreductase [Streptomyces sp. 049-1]|uniref:FAD-dependent oxidoreductase n=1 Tax=Streptomyces sp. 049-1 TaxID=2789264 RepID=UPI00397EE152